MIPLFSDHQHSDDPVRLDIDEPSDPVDDGGVDDIARVLARRRAGHPDPYKVALCIEGGGMRGVVSAGMVAALQQLDGARLFDHVYGSSAGALNGAYFLAGQAEEGLPIYFEDLPERRFVSWPRYLRGGPLLHLDDLIDEVMTNVRPLDFQALHRGRPTFHALAYDLVEQHVVAMPDPHDREGLFERLRASCRVPVFGGPPVVHGEHAWCDPLLHEPIPCRTPLALGATHLVVLSTRPTPQFSRAGVVQRSFEGRLLSRWDPRLATSMVTEGNSLHDDVTLLEDLVEAGRALVVAPAGPIVGRLETDADALRAGAERGRAAVMACSALTGGAAEPLPAAVPAPGESASTSVVTVGRAVPVGVTAPESGTAPVRREPTAQPDGVPDPPPTRRPFPQLAKEGVAWCRESTRRRSAQASELVASRMPIRRRGQELSADGREGAPRPVLTSDGAAEVPLVRWRRRSTTAGQDGEDAPASSWSPTSVWSHRVRSR